MSHGTKGGKYQSQLLVVPRAWYSPCMVLLKAGKRTGWWDGWEGGTPPADLMEDHLAAPVPPSWPEMST